MHDLFVLIETLLKECLKEEIALAKVYAYRKLAKITARILILLTLLFLVFLFCVVLSIFFTIVIGEATGSYALGTFLTLLFYLLLFCLTYFNRHSLSHYFYQLILRRLFHYDRYMYHQSELNKKKSS